MNAVGDEASLLIPRGMEALIKKCELEIANSVLIGARMTVEEPRFMCLHLVPQKTKTESFYS